MRERLVVLTLMSGAIALAAVGSSPAEAGAQQSGPAGPLVLEGITVVDVERGKLVPRQRVVIVGNRVQSVSGSERGRLPADARLVNAEGKYLIPGLWDMHTHAQRHTTFYAPLYIANGVTGIRDAATEWPLDSLLTWRQEILAGTRVGPPRQILSGHSIDERKTCKRQAKLHTCVTDSADARHLIDSLRAAGADMLKMYGLSRAMYLTIAAEARRIGIPFGGHTSKLKATEASDSGAGLIDHSIANKELIEHCLYQMATVERCRPVAERFARNNTWWVPTWIYPPRRAGRAGSRSLYANFDAFVKDFWADSTNGQGLYDYLKRPIASGEHARGGSARSQSSDTSRAGSVVDSLGYLYVVRHAGLPVLAGTDTYGLKIPAGFALHTELATYVSEGLTPLQALQAATIHPAKFLGATDSLGSVAPGKLADLVLLDADPLTDIINTASIRAVIANGRYFDRAALDRLLDAARAAKRAE